MKPEKKQQIEKTLKGLLSVEEASVMDLTGGLGLFWPLRKVIADQEKRIAKLESDVEYISNSRFYRND